VIAATEEMRLPPGVLLLLLMLLLGNLPSLGSTWQLDEGLARSCPAQPLLFFSLFNPESRLVLISTVLAARAGGVAQANLDQCTIARAARDSNEHGGRPLLLPRLASGWPAVSNISTRRWSKARLRELAASASHAVRWPVGQRAFGLVGAECRLDAYLDSAMGRTVQWSAAAGSLLMFGRTNVGVDELDWLVPERFARRQLSSRVLSVGGSTAGLALHNHGEAFEAVIIGNKLVVFLPPLPIKHGVRTTDATAAARLHLLSMPVSQLVALPAAQRDTLLIAGGWNPSDFTSCTLFPGDAVWIPCNYYHGTMNIGDTVAVGGQVAQGSSNEAVHEEDCPNDVFSLAAAQLSKAAGLISTAEAQPALSSGRADWSHPAVLQMLDKADRLLRETAGTLAMNVEAAIWAGRSAFLRRRVSGSCDDEERSALLRLNSTALMWVSAARLSNAHDSISAPSIHVAHAAAVLTGMPLLLSESGFAGFLAYQRLAQVLGGISSLRCDVGFNAATLPTGGTT
jgi:hypothetical protein